MVCYSLFACWVNYLSSSVFVHETLFYEVGLCSIFVGFNSGIGWTSKVFFPLCPVLLFCSVNDNVFHFSALADRAVFSKPASRDVFDNYMVRFRNYQRKGHKKVFETLAPFLRVTIYRCEGLKQSVGALLIAEKTLTADRCEHAPRTV